MPSIVNSRGTLLERFARKIQVTDNCWLWLGSKTKLGYGWFNACGKAIKAHRFAFEIYKGFIPRGKELDHLCRNPSCVNPDHLEAVTHRENVLRGKSPLAKQAKQTHCKRGHEYTLDNTHLNTKGHGLRSCRQCIHMHNKARYRKYA